jgi:hypothetical protein
MADQNKNSSSAGFNPIGLCMGMGVGLCFGVAMDNMGAGIALGMGVGLCFCVALGRKPDESGKKQDEDKK